MNVGIWDHPWRDGTSLPVRQNDKFGFVPEVACARADPAPVVAAADSAAINPL